MLHRAAGAALGHGVITTRKAVERSAVKLRFAIGGVFLHAHVRHRLAPRRAGFGGDRREWGSRRLGLGGFGLAGKGLLAEMREIERLVDLRIDCSYEFILGKIKLLHGKFGELFIKLGGP